LTVRHLTAWALVVVIVLLSFHALAVRFPSLHSLGGPDDHFRATRKSSALHHTASARTDDNPSRHDAPSNRQHGGGCEFCHGGVPVAVETNFALPRPIQGAHACPVCHLHMPDRSHVRLPPSQAPPKA
jgi:hypothetical protein